MKRVKFLDTYSIFGQYDSDRDQVELSVHLKDYPELMGFVLLHELTHASFKRHSLHHFWLEIKDRFRFMSDRQLQMQFHCYNKDRKLGFKNTRKDIMFMIGYASITQISLFVYFFGFLWRQILTIRNNNDISKR